MFLFPFSPLTERSSFDYSPEEHELLRRHHHSSDDEWTDLDLVMDLLHHICSTTCDGEKPPTDLTACGR